MTVRAVNIRLMALSLAERQGVVYHYRRTFASWHTGQSSRTWSTLMPSSVSNERWQSMMDNESKKFIFMQHTCCFSTSSTKSIGRENEDKDSDTSDNNSDNTTTVLFERNSKANKLPRACLGVAIFNSAYWTWYAVDFIPNVNQHVVENVALHVNPWIGLGGCVFAYALNTVALLYCRQLVSRLELDHDFRTLRIYMHKLPWMIPGHRPTVYNLGQVTLDENAREVVDFLESKTKRSNVFTYTGMLPIRVAGFRWPLGMHVHEMGDIKNADTLLDVLLLSPFEGRERKKKQSKRKNRKARR